MFSEYSTSEQQHQRGGGGSWQQQSWAGSIGVRYASTRSSEAASSYSGFVDDSASTSGTDLTPPVEYFPLPESSAAEVASAIHQACEALERASILGAKADTFFSASWCITGLQTVHETMGSLW